MLTITPAGPIARARRLGAEEAAGERRADRVGEELRLDLHRIGRDEAARGRVHEDVEPAERRRGLLDRAPRECAVGEVGSDRMAARAGRGELGGRRLGVGRRAVVGERDLRAALGQPQRDRAAEAAGASGHEHAGARDVHGISRPRA